MPRYARTQWKRTKRWEETDLTRKIEASTGRKTTSWDVSQGTELCDFCSSENPIKEYVTEDYIQDQFQTPRGKNVFVTSRGNWWSCADCATLIESKQWQALEDRCVKAIADINNGWGRLPALRQTIRKIHGNFREQWIGDWREVKHG